MRGNELRTVLCQALARLPVKRLPGKPYVAVSSTDPNHVVTVVIPKEVHVP
ncbi:hypothetical protein ACH4LN_25855 [Streptomyces albus]|uniref:hypothetical protein n=1 Tax=Streptomyces TaxID=1883 RepID=UPI000A9560EA|nr:hypothetical protein [Streptomyces albus]